MFDTLTDPGDLVEEILSVIERRRLAALIGVSESAIRKWKLGLSTPRLETLGRLVELANLTAEIKRVTGAGVTGGNLDQ